MSRARLKLGLCFQPLQPHAEAFATSPTGARVECARMAVMASGLISRSARAPSDDGYPFPAREARRWPLELVAFGRCPDSSERRDEGSGGRSVHPAASRHEGHSSPPAGDSTGTSRGSASSGTYLQRPGTAQPANGPPSPVALQPGIEAASPRCWPSGAACAPENRCARPRCRSPAIREPQVCRIEAVG